MKKQDSRKMSLLRRMALLFLTPIIIGLPILLSCNEYPMQQLVSTTYAERTDSQVQTMSKRVDILFLVDNSGSMKEEQDKLKANFDGFIRELLQQDVNDFQIGVITTDMDDTEQSGKLQAKKGYPRIIKGSQMTTQKVIEAFKANTDVGVLGSPYEKGLAAIKAALSPPLINTTNKGFLRDNSLLAIILLGDEDDCSHNGQIPEDVYLSDVCFLPPNQILLGADGKPQMHNGKPIHGQQDKLYPVSRYIKFLKSLKDVGGRPRDVIVSGLIGNPMVLVPDNKDPTKMRPIDPPGGCKQDIECVVNGTEKHYCGYVNSTTRRCGGCKSKDATANVPGIRFFELIQAFTPGEAANKLWYPICGDNAGFKKALLDFAGAILNRINFVVLSRVPAINKKNNLPYLQVFIVFNEGTPQETRKLVKPAAPTGKACQSDKECGKNYVCGPDSQCYGDGWVYFAPIKGGIQQARIALSGKAKEDAKPGSKIQVSYASGQ